LVRILYQRNWDKQRIIDLFSVVDWMVKLPEELEQQIWHEIKTIEEHEKMKYITSVERICIAKGLEQGLEQGRVEGVSKLLKKQLEHRFGVLPTWAINKLTNAIEQDLNLWGETILTAPTLTAVFDHDTRH